MKVLNYTGLQNLWINIKNYITAHTPTKTSDLTNDSNFVDTSNSAVASGITSAKVTDYDAHIANTDIHVTTADKTKWNNGVTQAYVFRYSSTAITDNSTIAYSTLDNTDNIKATDKIIDVDGKIFSVVSVDSDNSTVTVGSALIDLALDANVVHTSGNETVGGVKSFSDNISTKKIISNVAQLQINARSSGDSVAIIAGANATEGGGIWIYGKDNVNNSHVALQVYDTTNSTFHAVRLNMDGALTPTVSNNGLGSKSFKWVGFNGLNPGALSFPDLSNGLDISGYITLGSSDNTYTPPVDGWICIYGYGNACALKQNNLYIAGQYISELDTSNRLTGCCLCVKGGVAVDIFLRTVTSLSAAYFYPCLGNV